MDIAKKYENVKQRIEKAALRANRNPKDIKLVTVTKTHPVEVIEKALQLGIEYIGENKVQEAEAKLPKLKGKYKEFHFIGHLQSNKIKNLIPLCPTLIHSLDKFSTIRKLHNYLQKNELHQDILIEVNTSGEESKFGVEPSSTLPLIKAVANFSNVHIKGLMTIGKLTDNKDEIRTCFSQLRELQQQIAQQNIAGVKMELLSMGMTNDFEIAIEEGANIVRIGTAILGPRQYKEKR